MENRPEELTGGDKTPEQIQAEMQQTREALTHKVAALETQVVGTVQTAADTLTGTVEAVKSLITTAPEAVGDTVQRSLAAVSDTVKKNLNVTELVRDNPWTAVGVSAAAGFLTGFLTGGPVASHAPGAGASRLTPPTPAPAGGRPGVFDELFAMLGSKVREIAETAIDSATRSVKQNVQDEVPKLIDAAAANLHPSPESDRPHIGRHNGARIAGYGG